jgi:hypothetical protein
MKHSETDNLLSLIFQSDGTVKVENGQLLIGPVALAQRFGDQIRRLKPEILIALGCCPICAEKLIVEVGEDHQKKTGRHAHCGQVGHFDQWSF